jgi:hypothetical protein
VEGDAFRAAKGTIRAAGRSQERRLAASGAELAGYQLFCGADGVTRSGHGLQERRARPSARGSADETAAPHASQNRATSPSSAPHDEHLGARGPPHPEQKRATSRFQCPHVAQVSGIEDPRGIFAPGTATSTTVTLPPDVHRAAAIVASHRLLSRRESPARADAYACLRYATRGDPSRGYRRG